MGKPATLLERLCEHVRSLGADSISVELQDGREWVYACHGNMSFSIASFQSSSEDAKELRRNLWAAAKKPIRAVLGGELSMIEVRAAENFGDWAFEVAITPAPQRDLASSPRFTAKQGQYLAFIYQYSKIHRQPPAEIDLQRYFRVSAPSVHAMIKTLERNGLIQKEPGRARTIRLLILPEHLPPLGSGEEGGRQGRDPSSRPRKN
jgi:iron dependent repressor-like protein